MTLAEFLLARVAEDEARANRMEHYDPDEGGYYACPGARSEPLGDLEAGEDACTCGLSPRKARALAECESKRSIVMQCAHFLEGDPMDPVGVEDILGHLASVYADHPDYDPNWAV